MRSKISIRSFEKRTPIYTKFHTDKILNLSKKFSRVFGTNCRCKVFTNNKENKWTFNYYINDLFSMTLIFCQSPVTATSTIYIDNFYVIDNENSTHLKDTVLKIILSQIKSLDFEKIISKEHEPEYISTFLGNNFKYDSLNELSLTLKSTFIRIKK